jgi:hypothetical protein
MAELVLNEEQTDHQFFTLAWQHLIFCQITRSIYTILSVFYKTRL